jgi:hypothetical protein
LEKENRMNDLALIAIGLGLGLALALVAVMVYALYRAAQQMRHSASQMLALGQRVESVANSLRTDLTTALSRLDAERLYSASLALSRLVKSLGLQVDTLQRTVFNQPPSPALDFTQAGMAVGTELDEEAADDAGMLANRNRWSAMGGGNVPQGANSYSGLPGDPLAGLSEEEKRWRVLEHFERKRAAAAGTPYPAAAYNPSNPLAGFTPSATPPAAGSGAYASLLEEAGGTPQPSPSPADFAGLEPEDGVELTEKSELQ